MFEIFPKSTPFGSRYFCKLYPHSTRSGHNHFVGLSVLNRTAPPLPPAVDRCRAACKRIRVFIGKPTKMIAHDCGGGSDSGGLFVFTLSIAQRATTPLIRVQTHAGIVRVLTSVVRRSFLGFFHPYFYVQFFFFAICQNNTVTGSVVVPVIYRKRNVESIVLCYRKKTIVTRHGYYRRTKY